MKCVVKRKGHEERFSERKLYRSCYCACKSAHLKTKECAKIARSVTSEVKKSAGSRKCVTSAYIHKAASKALKRRNRDAGFMYETHRDIS